VLFLWVVIHELLCIRSTQYVLGNAHECVVALACQLRQITLPLTTLPIKDAPKWFCRWRIHVEQLLIYDRQWRLLRGGRLIIMAGNHVFDVFDTVPLIPLQPLPWAHSPQIRCHQPPVMTVFSEGREADADLNWWFGWLRDCLTYVHLGWAPQTVYEYVIGHDICFITGNLLHSCKIFSMPHAPNTTGVNFTVKGLSKNICT
jgi:hypothetical protein